MIELTDKERAVLSAACVRVQIAQEKAQAAQRDAQLAAREVEARGNEARGVFRSIMELGDRNPEAYELNWDGEKVTVEERPQAAEPVAEKPDLKVVESGDA